MDQSNEEDKNKMSNFKRVISNPDDVGRIDAKIWKQSMSGTSLSLLNSEGEGEGEDDTNSKSKTSEPFLIEECTKLLATKAHVEKDAEGEEYTGNSDCELEVKEFKQEEATSAQKEGKDELDENGSSTYLDAPVATIEKPHSADSATTHSSLSDNSGDKIEEVSCKESFGITNNENVNYHHMKGKRVNEDPKTDSNNTEGPKYNTVVSLRKESSDEESSKEGVGSSMSSSESSRNTSGSTAGNTASGNWGWFEDMHENDHVRTEKRQAKSSSSQGIKEGPILKDVGGVSRELISGKPSETDSVDEESRKKKSKKKKKIGAMLQFGEALSEPLNELVEHSREEQTSMAVTAPTYVLEESISSQRLWKDTAGTRPPQPVEERAFFEKMWAQNFKRSQVMYEIPVEVLTATSPISLSPFADGNFGEWHVNQIDNFNLRGGNLRGGAMNAGMSPEDASCVKAAEADAAEATLHRRMGNTSGVLGYYGQQRTGSVKSFGPHHHHHTLVNKKLENGDDDELTIVVRGDNVFGTTVSKSFSKNGDRPGAADTVSISVASYRVVQSKKHGKYAQFLVIYCQGSFRETVGVWKRYSDFDKLSRRISQGHGNCSQVLVGMHPLVIEDVHDSEYMPNAITSWRLLKKRQRWFRCLDAGYLSLKVFLLERFLHDILFESSNASILRDFVGVHSTEVDVGN